MPLRTRHVMLSIANSMVTRRIIVMATAFALFAGTGLLTEARSDESTAALISPGQSAQCLG